MIICRVALDSSAALDSNVAVLACVNWQTTQSAGTSVTHQPASHGGREITLAPRSRGRLRYEKDQRLPTNRLPTAVGRSRWLPAAEDGYATKRTSVTHQPASHGGREITLAPRSRGRLRYEKDQRLPTNRLPTAVGRSRWLPAAEDGYATKRTSVYPPTGFPRRSGDHAGSPQPRTATLRKGPALPTNRLPTAVGRSRWLPAAEDGYATKLVVVQ